MEKHCAICNGMISPDNESGDVCEYCERAYGLCGVYLCQG